MAQNQHINKVIFGSATLVDLTGTTATADKILTGYGAYGADGAWMDGTAEAGGGGLSCELLKSIVVSGGVATDQKTGETVNLSSVDIGAENWNSNKIIYFQWRRANPPFSYGDYIGVDQFIVNYQIGSTATSIAASRIPGIITRVNTKSDTYTAVLSNTSRYGILVTTFYKTGKMQLYGTLDGIINIYSIDYPGFGNPFQPIAPPAEGGEN